VVIRKNILTNELFFVICFIVNFNTKIKYSENSLPFFYILKKSTLLLLIFHFLIGFFLLLQYYNYNKNINKTMLSIAEYHFNRDLALRLWGSSHGGVYVPISKTAHPNPHLKHIKKRDIITKNGQKLTLINPAYMIRQLNDKFKTLIPIHSHISSLKHLRSETAPYKWEVKALKNFEKGKKKYSEIVTIKDKKYFRFMKPMITKKSCLKCHGHQNYKIGDIRGGTSIEIPMKAYLDSSNINKNTENSILFIFWFIGIISILIYKEKSLLYKKVLDSKVDEAQNIINKSSIVVFSWQNKKYWPVEYVSKNVINLLGHTKEEFESKKIKYTDFIHPLDIPQVKKEVLYTMRNDLITEFNHKPYRIISSTNAVKWVETTTTIIRDDNGNIIQFRGIVKDISKRIEIEQQLEEKNIKIKNLLSAIQSIIISIDIDNKIAYCNHIAEDIFNIDFLEIQNKNLFDVIENWDEHKIKESIGKCIQHKRKVSLNDVHFYVNEEIHHLGFSFTPILDKNKEIISILIYGADITKKIASENEIKILLDVINKRPLSIVLTDISGNIEYVNPYFSKITGYSKEEAIGQNPRILQSGKHSLKFYEKIWNILLTGNEWHGEFLNKKKDGIYFWESVSILPIKNAKNRVIGYAGIKKDITEQKKAEKKIRTAHSTITQLITSIRTILIQVNDKDKIIIWNPTAEKTFNLLPKKILGKRMTYSKIPWEWNKVYESISMCFDKKKPVLINNMRYTKQDKSIGFLDIYILPTRNKKNIITGYILWGTDITEKKQLENRLLQAEKLESIGQLAAGVAHEINSPSQYISDNLSFIKDAFKDFITIFKDYKSMIEKQKNGKIIPANLIQVLLEKEKKIDISYLMKETPSAIKQALEGIKKVTEIVQSMKMFSHPGKKEKTIENINTLLKSTTIISKNQWKYVADVNFDLDKNLPEIACYPAELNQVFLNIIINSTQAIKDKFSKNDKQGLIKITTKKQQNSIVIIIRDNGIGIPKKIQKKVFDPFFTTKPIGVGTGQGLSISRNIIIKQHKGKITIFSKENKGTSVKIKLPI